MLDFSGQLVQSNDFDFHARLSGQSNFFFTFSLLFYFVFSFSLPAHAAYKRPRRLLLFLGCRANVVKVGCILFRFPRRGGRDVLYRSVVS